MDVATEATATESIYFSRQSLSTPQKGKKIESYTFRAMPIIARGKPYVSIMADHSDPGRILKYAPNPYL